MEYYSTCNQVPYTVAIQFDFNEIVEAKRSLLYFDVKNRISNHISLKYINYDILLSPDILEKTLKCLYSMPKIKRQPLTVGDFNTMRDISGSCNKALYLEVEPYHYLYNLHLSTIYALKDLTNIYEQHDLHNFKPHISCGTFDHHIDLGQLNTLLHSNGPIRINNWSIALHTSTHEYIIY